MAIGLTESDKEAIRYHLGYHNTEPTAAINLGFPSSNQQLFLVETAMERVVNQSAVSRIQSLLTSLAVIEGQMDDALKRFKAIKLGNLTLRQSNTDRSETDLLRDEYFDRVGQLASQLGVPFNANGNSRLQRAIGGGGMGSYRVVNRG